MERKKTVIILIFLTFLSWNCNPAFKFEGDWKIVYLEDRAYTFDRKPLSNMIIIYSDGNRMHGEFPITVSDKRGLDSSLEEMSFFKKDSQRFVVFKTVNSTNLFNDTFQIIYADKDSFFIRSRAVDLKCVKM